jgi:eukaryotic-like serine/threonine-protein kinase
MAICPECHASYDDEVQTCQEDGCDLVPDGLVVPAEVSLPAGMMVGEYRIEKKLGAGTFGDVYAGEQPLIGKRVAIKVLNQRFASDPAMVSRFVAEARAVNRIRQRNIIDIFSFGVLPGLDRHYFVMELLDGLTLAALMETAGRLPFGVVLSIVRGVADALDAVHEAGITHRDLKPDNVFLATERDGTYFPKLLDFGIAKLAYDDGAHRTGPGMVLGTPRYMSPEQARGKPIDHRTDIYALGVMIHEMLTATPLFGGDSSVDVLLRHTTEAPPPLSSVCPDLPPAIDAPVLAMLAKRPEDRPPSAGEAVAAFGARAKELGLDRQTEVASREPGGASAAAIRTPRDAPQQQGTTQALAPPALAPEPTEAIVAKEEERTGHTPPRGLRWAVIGALVVIAGLSLASLGRSPRPAREGAMTGLELPAAPVTSILAAPRGGSIAEPLVKADGAEPLVKPDVAAPEVVEVRLSTRPDDVEVWLGDRRLGSSAAPVTLPRGSERVELRLKKAGFQGEIVRLTPDQNRSAQATLSPLPPLPGHREPAPTARPASSASRVDRLLEGRD